MNSIWASENIFQLFKAIKYYNLNSRYNPINI